MPTTGYSGKTLAQKLGVKPHAVIHVIGAPGHYRQWLEPLPPGVVFREAGTGADIVHAFVKGTRELAGMAEDLASAPAPGGAIWISWPKKSSPMFVDLTDEGVRRFMLPTGWVDVKVCAVDADWSALKFLRRRS